MAKRSSAPTDAVAPSLDDASYRHLFMEARTVGTLVISVYHMDVVRFRGTLLRGGLR